jgi:hypothetical protein
MREFLRLGNHPFKGRISVESHPSQVIWSTVYNLTRTRHALKDLQTSTWLKIELLLTDEEWMTLRNKLNVTSFAKFFLSPLQPKPLWPSSCPPPKNHQIEISVKEDAKNIFRPSICVRVSYLRVFTVRFCCPSKYPAKFTSARHNKGHEKHP